MTKSRRCHVLPYLSAFDFRPSSPSFPSVRTSFLIIEAQEEIWPLKQPFRISRGSRTEARVVVVTISDGQHSGRGEAVPLARYKQSAASGLAQIESLKSAPGLNRPEFQHLQPAGAAGLLIDANESWSPSHCRNIVPALNGLGVELIEQPFPANADEVLETLDHPVPVCADESCHTSADLRRLTNRYEVLNVKLDKTGGLTEALLLSERARESGFKLLIGCMVCTSLGIAPARLLARAADYVDLDGPLLLAGDRHHRLSYQAGKIALPSRELWG